jgi:outer membrane protein
MNKNSVLTSVVAALVIVIIGLLVNWLFFTPRLAYIETPKILENFNEAIKIRTQLTTEKDSLEKQIKTMQDSLQRVASSIIADYDKASEKQKATMQAEVVRINAQFTTTVNELQQKVSSREQELMAPVLQKINDFLQIWGHDHHYSMILGTLAGGNIVAADRKLDVTMKVLHDLNEKYK